MHLVFFEAKPKPKRYASVIKLVLNHEYTRGFVLIFLSTCGAL